MPGRSEALDRGTRGRLAPRNIWLVAVLPGLRASGPRSWRSPLPGHQPSWRGARGPWVWVTAGVHSQVRGGQTLPRQLLAHLSGAAAWGAACSRWPGQVWPALMAQGPDLWPCLPSAADANYVAFLGASSCITRSLQTLRPLSSPETHRACLLRERASGETRCVLPSRLHSHPRTCYRKL